MMQFKHENFMFDQLTSRYTNTTFTPATDRYSKWDLQTPKAVVELKYRRGHNSRFPDTFIEKAKYDALLKAAAEADKVPVYTVYREHDNRIYTFHLDKLCPVSWKDVAMRAQTDFCNTDRIEKLVGKLYYEDAHSSFVCH